MLRLHHQAPDEEQRKAYQLIRTMLQIEKPLAEYEAFAKTHQDTRRRIADLFVLDAWYKRNIGVEFQHRHEFRRQLFDVINEINRSISDARQAACSECERVDLSDSPRIITIRFDTSG